MVVLHHISMAFSAAMAAVGTALFIALNHIDKRRVWTPESDYYMFREEEEEHSEKQVLVLGLDGAGKSSVLQGLSGVGSRRGCRPTRGFNFISLHTPACQLDFLEIGGGEDLRIGRIDSPIFRRGLILFQLSDSVFFVVFLFFLTCWCYIFHLDVIKLH
uniref:ADP-ribosylation factor-like 10 n=1 Tax=Sinocyclocheilus grahami TaxID=75366 RepID=A0A672SYB3_SINGR